VKSPLPLNGIGLVDLTFDEPLVLDKYQHNPVTGGLIFIDRLSNVTVGAVWCASQRPGRAIRIQRL
jgi:sulfate adenylyltransferase subunit 1 (EFTu-like GTPase family)